MEECFVEITGSCPRARAFIDVLRGCKLRLSGDAVEAVRRARKAYLSSLSRKMVYGAFTGVGALQTKKMHGTDREREERLVLEHAAGVGQYVDPEASRLALFTRVLQLTRGRSPVRPRVVEALVDMLNHDVVPAIPRYGSVGASGDLAPLAHIALAAMGKGVVWYKGVVTGAAEAFREEGLDPLVLEPGEALSLINGTAFSTGILAYSVIKLADLLAAWSFISGAGIGLVTCNSEHYWEKTVRVKKHPLHGHLYRFFLEGLGDAPGAGREECKGVVQDPYSLRCTPQALSAASLWLRRVWSDVLREACSPADNPVVIDGEPVHQCSFHGVHVALAADQLAVTASLLANAAERRIVHYLGSGPEGYEFLGDPSSPSGLMIAHYTAASLAAKIRAMSVPHSVHSIPTSMLQEDFVSMSANAALRVLEMTGLLEEIAAIELLLVARLAYIRGRAVLGDYWAVAEDTVSDIRRPISEMIASAKHVLRRIVEDAKGAIILFQDIAVEE